ncbi:MAG: hypothetical protein K6E76_04625 [Patescibacteria group bacterium]|nr:hypothetical protein [Patescibacteria group bacterium]
MEDIERLYIYMQIYEKIPFSQAQEYIEIIEDVKTLNYPKQKRSDICNFIL